MALSQKQAEDARVKIASILETAVSVEDAEHQFSELVGTPVKLKVIDPTEENAVGMRMTETFFGGRVIAKTGQMISAVSV